MTMVAETIDLPNHEIRALASLETADKEKRTVEVVWSAGTRGLRRSYARGDFYEELGMEPKNVDMSRFKSGAPVLNSHSQWDLRDVIGVVERAWLKDGKGHATVRLSGEEKDKDVVNKILDGIIRNVSVGYSIETMEEVERVGEIPVMRATKWTPHELSFVPVGFDQVASSRGLENTLTPCQFITNQQRSKKMDELEKLKTELRAAEDAKKAALAEAEALRSKPTGDDLVAAERKRASEITELTSKHKLDATRTAEFISQNKSIEDVRALILDEIASRDASTGTRTATISMGVTEKEHVVRAAEESILVRVAPTLFKPTEVSQRFRSASLLDIVRDLSELNGTRTFGMTKSQIAERGFHTSSDFPLVLGNALRKTLDAAYATQPSDYDWMTRTITVNDYKPLYRYGLSQGPAFLEVKEHGEYENGSIAESGETMAIKKYGRKFSVTRETLINDDLNAFGDLARMWSFGAAQLKAKLVWQQITSNPIMGDGKTLFHADHGNIFTGVNGNALEEANLEKAVITLETQKGFGAPGEDVQYLGIKAKYLIVAPDLKFTAQRLTTRIDAITLNTVNLFTDLVVKSDPRLAAGTWYVSADPVGLDAIGVLQMQNENGPVLSERIGFDVDGIDYKARFDIAAKMLDSKWIVKGK